MFCLRLVMIRLFAQPPSALASLMMLRFLLKWNGSDGPDTIHLLSLVQIPANTMLLADFVYALCICLKSTTRLVKAS
ncbi:hypothetical protein B0H66DRAFT_544774 [Apodospora peruviana]|uniref:Secreted protein n=1 Tax=Apodospora peruviana TaxID=516989 RepID=A0AAE0ITD0_9PEZI|nr:hypothetical protein B0H66DRAFT_544774 [Apodospora peruviana]